MSPATIAPIPLRLENYYVDKITFDVNSAFWEENDQESTPPSFDPGKHIDVDIQISQHQTETHLYLIILTVKLQDTPEAKTPYRIELVLNGIFRFVEDEEKDDTLRDRFLTNGGSTVLYGAAREFVMQLTARGPAGPILLPAVSFPPLRRAEAETPKREQVQAGEANLVGEGPDGGDASRSEEKEAEPARPLKKKTSVSKSKGQREKK